MTQESTDFKSQSKAFRSITKDISFTIRTPKQSFMRFRSTTKDVSFTIRATKTVLQDICAFLAGRKNLKMAL
jgi:hypothetical protein